MQELAFSHLPARDHRHHAVVLADHVDQLACRIHAALYGCALRREA